MTAYILLDLPKYFFENAPKKKATKEQKPMKSIHKYAIKPMVPNEVYTDREEFLTNYYDAAMLAKTRRSMSSLLLGMRRMGKTEIFKCVVNRLFFEQDHQDPNAAIPVFYRFPDETITRDEFALQYVVNFIRWYVAFKLRDVEILSKPKKSESLLKLIDKHIKMTRGFSVAIDLLDAILDKDVINPSNEAIHLPRTVSDLDDSTIIMFIDEFQNSRMPQYDFSVTGFYQEACESLTCPHFITGSAMSILAMELVGTGGLYGRFEFERIEAMTPYFATQLTHKASKYYQADISEQMAPFIAERCGGNPFYITAVVKRSAKIRKPIHDIDALNEVLAIDITSGFIWGELHDQVKRWIHRLNNFNITKWILYLSALDEHDDLKKDIIDVHKIQQALKDYEGVDIEIEEIQDILLKLSRGDLLGHHMGRFTRIKDPILNDFLKVWGQIELENVESGKIKNVLRNKYYQFSKRSLNEYKGYLGEIHMSQILLAAQRQTLAGDFFHYPSDIKIPDFSYVNHRARLSSGKNKEIDLLGAAGPETWVCQSKWVESKKIGIKDLKILNQQAESVKTEMKVVFLKKWIFAYKGLTAQAKKFAAAHDIFWSTRKELDALLDYLNLRPLYSFQA
jgi:hypothetical protein